MKVYKFIAILFLTFALTNCTSSDNEPVFVLSKDNLIGLYNIETLTIKTKTTTIVSNFPVIVNANAIGSLFQVDLVLKSDDTYTLKGEYVVNTTITSPGSSPVKNEEILTIDEAGTFAIDNTDNTLIFTNQNATFLSGKLSVSGFSETKLSLAQITEETISATNTTIEIDSKISFIKQ